MEYAVTEPSITDIERAAKRLGLKYTIDKEKAYPGKWYEKSGRILVEWEGTKLELLKEVSLKLKEIKK
jgi:signal recognition particle subunit SRP19